MDKKTVKPPRVGEWLFSRMTAYADHYASLGDLEEDYRKMLEAHGRFKARFWYWTQVCIAIPKYITLGLYWRITMLQNYLKIAYRNLMKSKGFSFINIFGLAIGMSCSLVLFMYVHEELTYDRYHQDRDRVFRVYEVITSPTAVREYAPIAWPLAPAILDKLPQLESAVRIYAFGTRLVRRKQEAFYEDRFIFADPSLFDVLTFKFLQGNQKRALERPNTIVITRSSAYKYFGDQNPLGKTVEVNDQEYEITGLIQDTPRNTHLKVDFIASMKSIEDEEWMSNWHGTEAYTYLKLRPGVNAQAFEQSMRRIGYDYVGDLWTEWKQDCEFLLQPIDSIHLHSHLRYEREAPGNASMILLIGGIGVLVLLVACMNYVNLATARSVLRAREVGLRKVVGADRRELIRQFWGESFILAAVTMLFSMGLLVLAFPFFNQLAGTTFAWSALFRASTLRIVLGIILFCGLGAGIYPSFLLSSYQPAVILRGTLIKGRGGAWVRRVMVVFQFAISILLAVSTLIIFQQIQYMKDQYPGFDRNQKLVIPVRGEASIRENSEQIKNEFLKHTAVTKASASSSVPGRGVSNFSIAFYGEEERMNQGMYHLYYDPDFIDQYSIEIIAGRNFEASRIMDFSTWDEVGGYILNHAAMKAFGISDPLDIIGRRLQTGLGGRVGPVIGVTRDFHYRGLQQIVEPLIMECFPNRYNYITLTVDTRKLDDVMVHVDRVWKDHFPDVPLVTYFLDEDFNRQYLSEEQLGDVAGTFTVMGLIVACLGLLGLASFTAAQRTKEIGIRKVLGASIPAVLLMLSHSTLRSVVVANAVAWPLTWWLMTQWLNRFAVRMQIHAWPFLLAGTGTLLMALLTVSVQSLRAALANPVDSLRYE